ncbi:hypothetical protein Clacol_003661 [Clathrus columnatus]|uniref:Uncharacterized protein n=1 Tax=Clathrus columnatus TaxID=1419009 RepID=A0AAV5A863_9AGAM|nr:hypothetical protein Clacol_003661 [Clathrus columnatus]
MYSTLPSFPSSLDDSSTPLEPDFYPLYPSPATLDPLISNSNIPNSQKRKLVQHSLIRASTFGDLTLLVYLLSDSDARQYVDLSIQDDDGLCLISIIILGFGAETERDIEREECIRLLANEGADVNLPDNAGWTPIHHASLFASPSLVSFLITHGCSPLTLTNRGLTPLDILTAHSLIPGREAVALLVEEAMRERGWTGGKVEKRRRREEERSQAESSSLSLKQHVGEILGLNSNWWGGDSTDMDDSDNETDDDSFDQNVGPMELPYTPSIDFTSMLVFSPGTLSTVLDSLTFNSHPGVRCSEPARALYLLARFACLTCDDTWLEDLMGGAVDRIERIIFANPDDIVLQTFWLYNMTVLLHFIQCDNSIADICDLLELFALLQGLIRAIYVFIIRIAERKVDTLLDGCFLDHTPLSSEFDNIQFEKEWSFLRSFAASNTKLTKKRDTLGSPILASNGNNPSPRSPSPSSSTFHASSQSRTWTQSLTRTRASSLTPALSSFISDSHPSQPQDITTYLDAFYSLLVLAGINPAIISQIYSQILYWTSCEMFNRILGRKKYLCRSRAIQISMNLSVLDEWIVASGLPQGIDSHFIPCLSSVTEFTTLVETIQMMKHLNPLQMRRAVRDYRYEISEGRMSEECAQYLAQLHKDWERRRIKLGVEAIRRDMHERDNDRESNISSTVNDSSEGASYAESTSTISERSENQRDIDLLFSKEQGRGSWRSPRTPDVLGELQDSRYMLPLLFPSDPKLLSAISLLKKKTSKRTSSVNHRGSVAAFVEQERGSSRAPSRASSVDRRPIAWKSCARQLRTVGIETLEWVDNVRGQGKWTAITSTRMSGGEDSDDCDRDMQDAALKPFESQSTKREISRADWERRLNEVHVTKADLNRLVMDYLVNEGYKTAAEEFSREAGIDPSVDFNSIESRMNIREAIQRGDVEEAIERTNDLNPEQQRLIEYIRHGRTVDALQFAQSELAPRGEENPEFLTELERTMALLAFDTLPTMPPSIAELLSPAQRLKTAGELNAAILESLSQGKESKLTELIRLMLWGEHMLMREDVEFPRVDILTGLAMRIRTNDTSTDT